MHRQRTSFPLAPAAAPLKPAKEAGDNEGICPAQCNLPISYLAPFSLSSQLVDTKYKLNTMPHLLASFARAENVPEVGRYDVLERGASAAAVAVAARRLVFG